MGHHDSTAATGNFELMLEEQTAPARSGGGYNPYDTFPNVRQGGLAQRQADLRKLSEWIRVKRQVSQLRKSDA
ncbi:MAG: hypothetical protein KGL25_12910 [Gammaproteobacteria bacterium]|nr:hypothetical protein [Gammaproteobacteria bacterium]MDE2252293.1 hypothetical protein [Gammaproteobacteria bacterium]